MIENDLYTRLGVALAIGLGVGIERGFRQRSEKSGERVAGLRTFALLALLGAGIAATYMPGLRLLSDRVSGRAQILHYGIGRFNEHCRKSVIDFLYTRHGHVEKEAVEGFHVTDLARPALDPR